MVKMGARILVVDDDADLLHLMGMRLGSAGYEVIQAESGEAALLRFRTSRPQLVITDLRMGEMDGLSLFAHLQAEAPTIPVIILTAHGTIPEAVSATQRGVFSFLTKPFDSQELMRRVADAVRLSPALDAEHAGAVWRKDLLTASVAMEEVLRQAFRIASEDRSALLIGATGSGKGTLATAIHQAGNRSTQPLVSFACTDHPADEMDQLLQPDNPDGLLKQAEQGVLYLQDIGALSLMAQARLFSVLFAQMQARDPLQRLALMSRRSGVKNVQVIASTPRPLDSAVAEGAFRNDLYYLLGGMTLVVPSLSERPEDIPLLVTHFLARMTSKTGMTLAADALITLQESRWPGNVRQLKTVLEQAADLSLTSTIPAALIQRVMCEYEETSLLAFDDARREFEHDYLTRLLQITSGNVSHAARVAQRNRTEFYKLLARHGLDPVSFKQRFR
jgi:two-component system response regulator GlrR